MQGSVKSVLVFKRPFCLILVIGLHYSEICSSTVSAQSLLIMLRTNVNHTTANKMPHDPALAYVCKCISYYTPFCSTNPDILTFLLFFGHVNSALADFQPRYCLPLPHLPSAAPSHLSFKQNITWRSLPWPPPPFIPHSLFCFLHSTWLMLFRKQGSWGLCLIQITLKTVRN